MGGERELFCKRDAQKEEELSKMIFQQKEERNNNFYYFLWCFGVYISLSIEISCVNKKRRILREMQSCRP